MTNRYTIWFALLAVLVVIGSLMLMTAGLPR